MTKREEFSLTMEQCQRLAETAIIGRSNFPKKWGEKPVPDDEQLLGREDIGALLAALRSYSLWLQGIGADYKPLFGDKGDWYPADKDEKRLDNVELDDPRITGWKFVNQKKIYKIRLNREALSGVVWCCILRLHPHGPPMPLALSTREALDTWWPLAEAIGKATAIRKYIGLAAAKRTDWEDDEVKEPADAKSDAA